MSTLRAVELGVLGPLQVRQDGAPVAIPGAKPRAILTMLGLHCGSVVSADALVELLWGEDPPRTAVKALQTHISSLRRALGDGFVLTEGTGWTLAESEVDASRYKSAARVGRDAAAVGDTGQAVACFEEARALWRGIPELPDGRQGTSEKTRWVEGHAALVEDRADALLATGRAAEIIGDLEAAVADAPLRERRWGQLMLALYRAGRQGEALGAYQRARALLVDELGVDPGPELRRLEAAVVAQDASLDVVAAQHLPSVMRAVTFLLTDIEGSTAAWEADADAMALALARHDELTEQVITSRGGRLIKTRGEGDATFSVFERPSAAAAAAIELQDAITHEQWGLREPMRIRIALHTGEVELRDGDYFGRAVNRAARLRSLAVGGQILCSGATAELVIDSLSDDVTLADLGMRQLKNLARPEHVFELRLETAQDSAQPPTSDAPMERPDLPSVLIGIGPFVGRGSELERLLSAWQTSLGGSACAALIAGEPGVGKTRLAGEWSRQAYEQGAVVLYGRCDEDLGAPYQPFAEALRSLVPCVGTSRLRALRGVEALLPLVPGLVDEVPDLAAPTRADPDTERYALFDAVVALLGMASTEAPVVLVLDDLHWAAKATLLLLRHLLRFGDRARVQIVGTYRSTDLDRSHPLAAMLADLHRDGTASRISLSGLDEDDVSAYVAKAGYDDEELGHALASVTGGNPFFLIEALRHVDESGGVWDPSTLPQGVREAVSRRLSRLPIETNKALAAAAVVGSRFALDLVERVVGDDLVDAFDEASKAGIVIEEPGGRYRFNHAIVRQSLLAELPSMRRMRLHQRIATTLEDEPGADDELLAELAHHYFECAWAGNAAKAVEYCRRAADQAMARLAYEGAADLYDHALHALDELDDELPDRTDQIADLLLARCEALLAAGDVTSAAGAVAQLQQATVDSARLSAWATCFDGQLSVLVHPERLDDVEAALVAAAQKLAEIDDAAGEAKAHTVRATCLARLGRIGDCEIALDDALTAARRAREHRRVNAVLAGAPLAALWGPNPVPRAGGRCLDVVRLLRITTDSPAVEATSTRCQAVLEAFRGRDAAARRMIDSARRTVTELGLRHALLEVEQFAGIVELVLDDPAAAEPRLRRAYNGFRRMGLDADTAETAALLGRACLALNREAEADELCTESERLAGHAFKPAIAWRTVRAQLLSRGNDHNQARRVAQAAITLAEHTDALVDHGDACLALATVLGAAGDAVGARAAAERAANLYERKGAAALAERARRMLDEHVETIDPTPPEVPVVETRTAAVQAGERVMAAIAREAWDEFEQMFAPAGSVESRRKIVGFKPTEFASDEVMRQTRRDLETGIMRANHVVMAVRGERLALARMTLGTVDVTPGAPQDEFLQVYGVDDEGRIALQIWFDLEDVDAAMAELDAVHARFEAERSPARRLSGGRELPSPPASLQMPNVEPDNECVRAIGRLWDAFDREAWDEVEGQFAAEIAAEYRRKIVGFSPRVFSPSDWTRQVRQIRAIGGVRHRRAVIAVRGDRLALTRFEIGTADTSPGAPQEELLHLFGLDNDGRIALHIAFDIEDMDAAIAELDAVHARFEDERPPARRLENAASRLYERFKVCYAARDWSTVCEMLADDVLSEDRRHPINSGVRQGRDALIAEISALAEVGIDLTTEVVATRGERLVLSRIRTAGRDQGPDGFGSVDLDVLELGVDGRFVARIVFDVDDFDGAIEELDARYLAGEAAAHARVWSVIMQGFASLNRRELPPTTPDWVNIDHRRLGRSIGPGEMPSLLGAAWNVTSDLSNYIEAVHRLNNLGAVMTHVTNETSQEGFHDEWRVISLITLNSDLVNRCEVFDEADLDAAIARFEQLGQPARRLENAASRVFENEWSHFAARDWDALAELVADNYSGIDHRRVVRAENQHGRDVVVKDLQAAADVGFTISMLSAIAIRGERLVLARVRASGRDPKAIQNDALNVIEIDAEERIVAAVTFDLEDIDAAITELDARYLAGEGAAHAHTWSVVAAGYAGFNRREHAATTPDWVSTDHRRGAAFAPGDMIAYIHAAWDDSPDTKIYIAAVHGLSEIGAVVTHVAHGISQDGFDAEWRDVLVLTIEGDLFTRNELFDEGDLDAAIARFEELSRPATRLENAASQVYERMWEHFRAQDWVALTALVADDELIDDRRRVVNGGVRHGRNAGVEELQAAADIGFTITMVDVKATRGDRLALTLVRASGRDPGAIQNDVLQIVEIDADERIAAVFTFDLEDLNPAIAELDARYLAGEAAAHARTWSVIAESYAAINRQEFPAISADSVFVDHRRASAFGASDLSAFLRAGLDLGQNIRPYVEAVHRLSDLGAVCSYAAQGVSQEGFDAEWQGVDLVTVDGDMIGRHEFYDEADLDTALARFTELLPQTRPLENAATQAAERLRACFAARDWDGLAEIMAEDIVADDRRRIVGTGIRRGRQANVSDIRVGAEIGTEDITSSVIATRGYRISLDRARFCASGGQAAGLNTELLRLIEVDTHNQMTCCLMFDVDDLDAAFEELDARYLAGEAADHARTWSAISEAYAALNRHEFPATAPDWVDIDHRGEAAFGPGDLIAYLRARLDFEQDFNIYIETVHRLTDLGAVITYAAHATSQEGFEAEWRGVSVFAVEGDMVNRWEVLDESDLDTALAHFDELHPRPPRLENAASRVDKRFQACFAARDWDVMAKMLSDGFSIEDRRRVVNMGNSHGRDAELTVHAYAAVGTQNVNSTVIATRAQRLALNHYRFSGPDQRPDAFRIEMLAVVEIDADERMAAVVVLDTDDIDAAIAELDARYLAGEAAASGRTWSAISGSYAAINRHEMPLTTPDCVNIDRRRETAMGVGDLIAYISAGPDRDQDNYAYVEAVHRLTERGAVVNYAAFETSQEGFDAEWRGIAVLTVDGELVNRTEIFDDGDLDAALASFEQLHPTTRRLENTATRVFQRLYSHVAAGEWHAVAQITAEDVCVDDRRRVVNAGILHGRDANIKDAQATVGVGFTMTMSGVVATRGGRLALTGIRVSGRDPEAIQNDALQILEVDAEERIAGVVVFDLEDFDAAIAELDARYIAGEAAAHARTWLAIAEVYAALNRGEMPMPATDLVDVDHRSLAAIGPGDLMAYLQAASEDTPRGGIYIETVHRLTDLGAVTTHVTKATSQEGFDAEWRITSFFTVSGDRMNRYEIFDEDDLEPALAGFEELSRPAPRLENTASQAYERIQVHFAARDWNAMAEALADDVFRDDRRRLVGAEIRRGSEAMIAEFSALAEIGVKRMTFDTIAIRGSRLVLSRARASGRDPRADAFRTEVLSIAELDADDRIAALITFDPDDFDAAIAELDARYLASDGAGHAHTWSVIAGGFGSIGRYELPPTTPDCVSIDHRRTAAFAPGELNAYFRAAFDLTADVKIYVEAVHRLNDAGAVCTHVVHGVSHEGFAAEWREVDVLMVEGNIVNHCEIFDEADLDGALARFDELQSPTPRLENAASQAVQHFWKYFAAREWAALAETMADDIGSHDRRRVVNGGELRGRAAHVTNMRAVAEVGFEGLTSTVIASRGQRLVLNRVRSSVRGSAPGEVATEMLSIVEIHADNRLAAADLFDADDIDAAIAETEARYLAGEAAAHAHTWSVITEAYAAFNRHELLAADLVTVDHRRATPFESSTMTETLGAIWDLTPDLVIRIEAVHRLSSFGAVVTHLQHGTSTEGFDAEWRSIELMTVDGDRINRCEIFDEADLDAALARFDELQPHAPRLEHPVQERFLAHFAARDWDAMGQDFADDYYCDDRRRVVNAGVRHGRDAAFEDLRVAAEIGLMTNITSDIIATRGERLFLGRTRWFGPDQRPEDFYTEVLNVVEVDPEERIAAQVLFDANDIDGITAAFNELDARYLAGEAAAYAHTWSRVAEGFAAINRHELPELTPDWVNVDHRRGAAFATGEMTAYLHDLFDDVPDIHVYVEAVHRLDNHGAVATQAGHGTSQEGFQAEWREIGIFVFDGDLVCRYELFDEADLDAALARFDELSRPPLLENAATRTWGRQADAFNRRDIDSFLTLMTADGRFEDRRKGLRVVTEGPARRKAVQAVFEEAPSSWRMRAQPIAIRGSRLELTRECYVDTDEPDRPVTVEFLHVMEVSPSGLAQDIVSFDPNDIDAAFEELDARYLAGEAAAYGHTWSLTAQAYAAFNRHQLYPTAPDWVNIDHRRGIGFASGDMIPYLQAAWNVMPDNKARIEAVHRLSNFGAVITATGHGTSQEGFDAEWRYIHLLTFKGNLISRGEFFDETDLDAALARFDELQPQAPRLENAASQAEQRFLTYFAARNWAALAEILTDESFIDDRRPVVNAGLWDGRDAVIANLQALADAAANITSVIATRGERLALTRIRSSNRDPRQGDFGVEMLNIVEIDTDERIVAHVEFDPSGIDAAFEELDARYLVGEGAAHAHAWSVIARSYAAFNRHEFPSTAPDSVYIDHRPLVANDASDLTANIHATWELMDVSIYIAESVHRLSELGAVVTQTLRGTSKEGLDVEYRMIGIFTVEGDLLTRCEVFDEKDIDAALARFDELQPQAPRLENVASQVEQRFLTYFATRDWDAYAEILSDDVCMDDRRQVVNAGVRRGRDAEIASMRAIADVGVTRFTSTVIAIRGGRLALGSYSVFDGWGGSTVLSVSEINAENQIVARVAFDSEDIDAAFTELDARYLAGEATAHAHTWSLVMQAQAAWNRHEFFPNTEDWVNVDRRRGRAYAPGELKPFLRATWDVIPDAKLHTETVHRLTNAGVVSTVVATGTSQEGFDAEWREIGLLTFDGDLLSRCELFDEADRDAALARFDELQPQAPRLENAASQVHTRLKGCFASRDWEAMAELLADDIAIDDRRRAVNSGIQYGRDAAIADMRGAFDVGLTNISLSVIATRGVRLELCRTSIWGQDRPDAFRIEFLSVVEINADEQIVARVAFDLDDIDAAFKELDARYLAGEAAAQAHTWSVITEAYAALNRQEIPPSTPEWVNIDHRAGQRMESDDLGAYVQATWNVKPYCRVYIEAVHRLSEIGAVVTYAAHGTSQEGFDAEWRAVSMAMVSGDLVDRSEIFDETELNAALARFDELDRQTSELENAATQTYERLVEAYNQHDREGFLALTTQDGRSEDRRKGLLHIAVGPEWRKTMRSWLDAPRSWRMDVEILAIRGSHLSLTRNRCRDLDEADQPVTAEILAVTEVNEDGLVCNAVSFDPDAVSDAFAELTARWIASGDVAHPGVIEASQRHLEILNRHDWEAFAALSTGATHINHRQLSRPGIDTVADHMPSFQAMASLVPDCRLEPAEVLTHSAAGFVSHTILRGTSTDGAAVEISLLLLVLVEGERVTHLEAFDSDQRDSALARFEELNAIQ